MTKPATRTLVSELIRILKGVIRALEKWLTEEGQE